MNCKHCHRSIVESGIGWRDDGQCLFCSVDPYVRHEPAASDDLVEIARMVDAPGWDSAIRALARQVIRNARS